MNKHERELYEAQREEARERAKEAREEKEFSRKFWKEQRAAEKQENTKAKEKGAREDTWMKSIKKMAGHTQKINEKAETFTEKFESRKAKESPQEKPGLFRRAVNAIGAAAEKPAEKLFKGIGAAAMTPLHMGANWAREQPGLSPIIQAARQARETVGIGRKQSGTAEARATGGQGPKPGLDVPTAGLEPGSKSWNHAMMGQNQNPYQSGPSITVRTR